jgi:predicted ABC-type ATPase
VIGSSPKVVVLAGPNGAGKSTSAHKLLLGLLKVQEFVNADTIAAQLPGADVALEAGRLMLARLQELATTRADFAFETTMASRSFAPWLADLQAVGYTVHLIFLWLPSPDEAVARVADRVRDGGHDVPEATIRRRYDSGLKNLLRLYIPLADTWRIFDNSVIHSPRRVAIGGKLGPAKIFDSLTWSSMEARVKNL